MVRDHCCKSNHASLRVIEVRDLERRDIELLAQVRAQLLKLATLESCVVIVVEVEDDSADGDNQS